MIPTFTKIDVESSGDFKSLSYGIKDPGMIFDILRNKMYSDPITSIVREISCNAIDAHREAGKADVPIKIHLPTKMEPYITFTDYGIGISPDCMEDIFVNFGASTKRNSNDYIGAFGMGSKIPLSYSDSFTIITKYNGVKRNYCSYIDETNIGKIALLEESETDESNGTTISIPVKEKDFHAFEKAAESVFEYIDILPEFNHFDRKEPLKLCSEVEKLKIFNDPGAYYSSYVILIDFVPYPLDVLKLSDSVMRPYINSRKKFVLSVPNGLLSISSSRETIHYDEKTIKHLETIFQEYQQKIKEQIENLFLTTNDPFEQLIKVFYSGLKEFYSKKLEIEEFISTTDIFLMRQRSGLERFYEKYNVHVRDLRLTPDEILKFPRFFFADDIPYSSTNLLKNLKEIYPNETSFLVYAQKAKNHSREHKTVSYEFYKSFRRFVPKRFITPRVKSEFKKDSNTKEIKYSYKKIFFFKYGKIEKIPVDDFFSCKNPVVVSREFCDRWNCQNIVPSENLFLINSEDKFFEKSEILKERNEKLKDQDIFFISNEQELLDYMMKFQKNTFVDLLRFHYYEEVLEKKMREKKVYFSRKSNFGINNLKAVKNPSKKTKAFIENVEVINKFLKKLNDSSNYSRYLFSSLMKGFKVSSYQDIYDEVLKEVEKSYDFLLMKENLIFIWMIYNSEENIQSSGQVVTDILNTHFLAEEKTLLDNQPQAN